MEYDFNKAVKLFMIFDILGDTERTGPLLWKIDRFRLEDIKDHVFDLFTIAKELRKYFPSYIDFDKITDYILCHDLPEAITGDITKFEGVPEQEIERVTEIAIDYLANDFSNVLDLKNILNNYENRSDIESKIVHMIDKLHSSSTFIKYESEESVDMDKPGIIPVLRNHPFVVEKIKEGKDLADIFFEFHMKAINISDEECNKYSISRDDADKIVFAIRGFANELYKQKLDGTLLKFKDDFPSSAMIYNRNNSNLSVSRKTTKILLGSKNPSKKLALELALNDLGIKEYDIVDILALSNVDSRPIGYEIIRGADNRNKYLKEYAKEHNIKYDYLCSIEGGYSLDENGLPFVVTYCIIEDNKGKRSTGKSLGIRLSKTMFDYLKKGHSLNQLIEEISNTSNNKQKLGITGYLSRGLYNRANMDKDAIVSSFIPFIYSEERNLLNQTILDKDI